jgi:hypothetical protein
MAPELDIITYFAGEKNLQRSTSTISNLSKEIFHQGMAHKDPSQQYFISLYTISSKDFSQRFPEIPVDSSDVILLRSVLMRPEQEYTVEELLCRIEADAKNFL